MKKAAQLSSVSTRSAVLASLTVEKCESCRAWMIQEDGKRGICRFNPPQLLVTEREDDGNIKYASFFPVMLPEGWCAQWRRRDVQ